MKRKNYTRTVLAELDFHGFTSREAIDSLQEFLSKNNKIGDLRIIIGKGNHSVSKSILGPLVKEYLSRNNYSWRYGKLNEGGEGVVLVGLKP